ncbi:putative actin patch assembly and actin polymerization protein [Agyrium rufum]|nr:putative actin patch assembly and actin polymerization protein [Agyrium rufum]
MADVLIWNPISVTAVVVVTVKMKDSCDTMKKGEEGRNDWHKPYSAVTVQIERLTSEQFEVNDYSGLPDLIEVVRIQSSGPTEAARAIRKKLKYGNPHRQLRSLTILDGLIQNAGERFQRTFADEPLLERLRTIPTDTLTDDQVKKKCQLLYRSWTTYKSTPGLERIASLYQQLPQKRRPPPKETSKVLRETEHAAEHDEETGAHLSSSIDPFHGIASPVTPAVASPSSSRPIVLGSATTVGPPVKPVHKYDEFGRKNKSKHPKEPNSAKKAKTKPFNLEAEKPQLLQTIASSSVATTNLVNALRLVDREKQRVSENLEVVKRFETCKALRRQILRYIQHVDSEEWLGSLLHANEELVDALIAFEVLDKSVDHDSDSEDDEWDQDTPNTSTSHVNEGLAGLNLSKGPAQPHRPTALPMLSAGDLGKARAADDEEEEAEEDENDPFGDSNAVATPQIENKGMTWG